MFPKFYVWTTSGTTTYDTLPQAYKLYVEMRKVRYTELYYADEDGRIDLKKSTEDNERINNGLKFQKDFS